MEWGGCWDVNDVLTQIAERAANSFEASERGQGLLRNGGSLKSFMGRHKKTEHDLSGHGYVVSDRGQYLYLH